MGNEEQKNEDTKFPENTHIENIDSEEQKNTET